MRLLGTTLAALVLAWALPAAAAPDPRELMQRSEDRHRLPAVRELYVMVLQKVNGPKQVRQFEMLRAEDKVQGDKSYIRFDAPADVSGTAFLTVEQPNGDDDQWLYLPSFRKTRRVGTAELGDRFVGSDFFFEDMQEREIDDYAYTMLREEVVDGHPCYVIEETLKSEKDRAESPYSKVQAWLRKDIEFVVRRRMYDKRGRPLKEFEVADLKNVRGEAWRADKALMRDLERQHQTMLVIKSREVDPKIGKDRFSPHQLQE